MQCELRKCRERVGLQCSARDLWRVTLELHVQRRLLGVRRRQLHSVRSRKLQDVDRISSVHPLPTEIYLVSGELNSDELHMQRRLQQDQCGTVHRLWCRQVQDDDR